MTIPDNKPFQKFYWKIYLNYVNIKMMETHGNTILLLQETPVLNSLLEKEPQRDGTYIVKVSGLDKLPDILKDNNFDIILICQGIHSLKTLTALKVNFPTRYIPLFYLYSDLSEGWKEIKRAKELSNSLPDDFISIDTSPEILRFKISAFLKRLKQERFTNPLSGLPGNMPIEEEIISRLKEKSDWVLFYADLSNFKPYNDLYGFSKGDEVIRFLAKILKEVVKELNAPESFIGHIGGDDFIIILRGEKGESFCSLLQNQFSIGLNNFYSEKDLARGCIVSWSRDGERNIFPLLKLSIVSIPLDGQFSTIIDISRESARLKKISKNKTFVSDKNRMMNRVIPELAPDIILKSCSENENLPLAWRRAALEALGEIGNEEINPLITKFLSQIQKPRLRKSAAYALGKIKSPGISEILLPYINDPDPHVRTRVVEALGSNGDSQGLSSILALKDDPNPYVRSAVMLALGRMGDRASLTTLHSALKDRDKNVRLSAIGALGELKAKETIHFLVRQLSSADIKLKHAAARSLTKLSIPEVADTLIQLLTEKDPHIIWIALRGLVRLLETGWSANMINEETPLLQTFIRLLSHSNSYIRKESATALGYMGNTRAIEYLVSLLKDKNEFVRWATADALCRLPAITYLPNLISSLNDRNEYVRSTICRALAETKSQKALEPLRKILKDPSERVRESAAYSISRLLVNLQHNLKEKT